MGSPKKQPDASRGWSTMSTLGVMALCFLCYMLGAWQNLLNRDISPSGAPSATVDCVTNLNFFAQNAGSISDDDEIVQFESCGSEHFDLTPCQDPTRAKNYPIEKLVHRERHCPTEEEKMRCLVPAPRGYRTPFSWPKSRDLAWFANVPHKELTVEKAIQNWIQYEGDRFRFPGGGTMFPRGAAAYNDEIAALIPLSDGSIRTALDTGCGVASWGAALQDRNILAMSFAPRDSHEAQVQFALERGVPAMIGVLSTERMPYPARAFDMVHCSRCLIPWSSYDGLYLMEVDRVLRPGGYWVLSGPPINWETHWESWKKTTKEAVMEEKESIEALARHLCWTKAAEKGNIAIWQKPWNHADCAENHQNDGAPRICQGENPDFAWYRKLEACMTPLPEVKDVKDVAGGTLQSWPGRLTAVPPRISSGSLPTISADAYNADTQLWMDRVAYYKKRVITLLSARLRNVMDLNAGLGGFAAALAKDKVWVMNVVPYDSSTLGVIYERGLIGTYQDWCEAFSTYPRTYDLLHANSLLSLYQDRCNISDVLLEMDRILRPKGAVLMRDNIDVLTKARKIMRGMRWESKLIDHENGPFVEEKILVAVKKYWVDEEKVSNDETSG